VTLRWHPAGGHQHLRALVTERVRDRMNNRLFGESTLAERRLRVREEAIRVLREHRVVLSARDLARLVSEVSDEVVGLGPIEALLKDPDVTEVMVNGPDDVYVERKGRIETVERGLFEGEEAVHHLIERIVGPLGLRIDESSPWVDARLPDGSRFHAIIPPLSLCGPVVTVRKFGVVALGPEDLVRLGSATEEMITFLGSAVRQRANALISGGAGSGKTTLLGLLSAFIPDEERVVTIEDAAELRLAKPHVVRLEARPPNVEGRGAVTVRDLVRNALRMRPDRIIVGEVRGGEALDMLQAMNTGHEGSMSTAHANSPGDLLRRIETMALMSDVGLPVDHVREQIASTIDLVVHLARMSDGRRVISRIATVDGLEEGSIVLRDAFRSTSDPKDPPFGSDHKGHGGSPSGVPRAGRQAELVRGMS
jgi:pilus assembly protein CpaF